MKRMELRNESHLSETDILEQVTDLPLQNLQDRARELNILTSFSCICFPAF